MALSRKHAPVREDPQRIRPLDVPVIVGSTSTLLGLGRAPEIPIDHTLAEVLDYWRSVASWAPA